MRAGGSSFVYREPHRKEEDVNTKNIELAKTSDEFDRQRDEERKESKKIGQIAKIIIDRFNFM